MMFLVTGRWLHVGFQWIKWTWQIEPMCLSLEYLIHYKSTNGAFLDQIITGDETLLYHVTLKTKIDFMVWRHIDSPKEKIKTVDLVPRIMATVLWSAEDLMLVDLSETACSSLLQHTRQTEGSGSNNETVTIQHRWCLSWTARFSSCKIMFPCHMPPLLNLHHTASQEPVLNSDRILTENIVNSEICLD